MPLETLYHVTVLSNFARAFDKYSRAYDKSAIGQSTFEDRFFLLRREELGIGLEKAQRLLTKLALPGDRLVVLETRLPSELLHPNDRTGLGRFCWGTRIDVSQVHVVTQAGALESISVEEAMAASLRALHPQLLPYGQLSPRTLSVLPIARACQASCRFCFSESSVSLDQASRRVNLASVERWMAPAKEAGAERFVITGGGEPGLVRHEDLVSLMRLASQHFDKAVLITNGVHLAKLDEAQRKRHLLEYAAAGLTVLAVSRHHDLLERNRDIMQLDTGTERVLRAFNEQRESLRSLRLRLICVLQKQGVETPGDIERYLSWAVAQGVDEVCFKELYVSTTLESAYHAQPENEWSLSHQVPLAVLTSTLERLGFVQVAALPWGAPLYAGEVDGRPIRVAAYTEPSLFWERTSGIARSWNLMASGECLASLEDPASTVNLPGTKAFRVIPMVAA